MKPDAPIQPAAATQGAREYSASDVPSASEVRRGGVKPKVGVGFASNKRRKASPKVPELQDKIAELEDWQRRATVVINQLESAISEIIASTRVLQEQHNVAMGVAMGMLKYLVDKGAASSDEILLRSRMFDRMVQEPVSLGEFLQADTEAFRALLVSEAMEAPESTNAD